MRPAHHHRFDRIAVLATLGAVVLTAAAMAAPTGNRFAAAAGCDFRHARWGMTVAEVRAAEPGTPFQADGSLVCWQTDVGGQPCTVSYFFHQDRLCLGIYQFSDTNDELSHYFDDAKTYRNELVTLYGDPGLEKWRWADETLANDRSLWAETLGFGLMTYELGWLHGRNLVAMRMSGGSVKADIVILVASPACFAEGRRDFAGYFSRVIGDASPFFR